MDQTLTKYEIAKEKNIPLPDVNELTFHYLCGNLSEFIFKPKTPHPNFNLSWRPELKDFEKALEQELVVKRNENMAKTIMQEIQLLNSKEKKLFFTIGAGLCYRVCQLLITVFQTYAFNHNSSFYHVR